VDTYDTFLYVFVLVTTFSKKRDSSHVNNVVNTTLCTVLRSRLHISSICTYDLNTVCNVLYITI